MIPVTAILLAAGRGRRLGASISKPLLKIGVQPILVYCLKTLNKHPYIKDIVVVANPENRLAINREIKKYRITKVKNVVLGGRRRQDSVLNGLKALGRHAALVLIHDGARPFIEKDTISALIKEAQRTGASIVGVPVKETIKEVRSQKSEVRSKFAVKRTLERSRLWEIQTPQVFRKEIILEAFEKFGRQEATDDAMLVERLGVKVSLIPGSYDNIKITTPADLVLAECLVKKYGN